MRFFNGVFLFDFLYRYTDGVSLKKVDFLYGLQAIGVGENANRLYTGTFAAHPGKKMVI